MKKNVHHPSVYINAEDVNIIRGAAQQAEQTGLLHARQLETIYKRKWFKLLVPGVYSGLQISLPDLVKLHEAISWADGSTGWVVTLCSGAGWFGGFLLPAVAQQIFNNDYMCVAGSGATSGTAEITTKGYIINGSWKHATGAHHATHITANCIIKDGNKPVLTSDGEPVVLSFIFDKKDVTILPSWKYMGMIATGSDSFEIKNLEVAIDRQFKIEPSAAIIDQPLYRYPFLQLAETTLAVNLSGLAIHFLDLCESVFKEKIKQERYTSSQKSFLMNELEKSKFEIDVRRKDFYSAIDQSWNEDFDQQMNMIDKLSRVSAVSLKLAHCARENIDRLFPFCGLMAAKPGAEINRVWRDLHTASQHSLLTFI